MKGTYCYDYPRPALGTDVLLFSKEHELVHVLLIERKNNPFAGYWGFPGGFVEEGETCEQAAMRELEEETGVKVHDLRQLHIFSQPDRDPRGWVMTVAFWAWVEKAALKPVAGDDAKNVRWFPIHDLPKLAFDHREIMDKALDLLSIT